MKKIGIICILLIFISPEIPHDEIYELENIATIIEDNNLKTEEWMITLKEKMSKTQVQHYLTTFKKDHHVSHEADKNVIKYMIDSNDEVNQIAVTYEITIPQDDNYSPELVAIIKGTNLSKTVVEEYKKTLKYVRNEFFTKNYMRFTCLIASKNGKIASDDFSKKMSKDLQLKYVSTQSEMLDDVSDQETIYGYTTMWNNEIYIESKPLNVQVVIQGLKSGKQKVIIGTPILITEY